MKVRDLIKLEILNIVTNIKMTISIILGFIIVIAVILISAAYGISMNRYIKDVIDNNSSNAYCTNMFERFNENDMNTYSSNPNIEGIQVIKRYDINRMCDENNRTIDNKMVISNSISFDVAIMRMDGVSYRGKNDYSYTFDKTSSNSVESKDRLVKYMIGVMNVEDNLQISNGELQEYHNKFNKNNPFIAGEKLTKNNQIILTDYILNRFGINISPSDCIGKKINLGVFTNTGEFIFPGEYEICGVLDSDFFRINSRGQTPQIILSKADDKFCNINFMDEKIFGKGFKELTDFYSNCKNVDNICINSLTFKYAEVETQYILYGKIVIVISFSVIMSVMVFIYVLIYFYYKKKIRYICMQKAMGMNDFKVFSLIFGEIGIMQTIALIVSIPLFSFTLTKLNIIINMVNSNSLHVNFKDTFKAIGLTIVLIVVMNIIISFLQFRKIKKRSVTDR